MDSLIYPEPIVINLLSLVEYALYIPPTGIVPAILGVEYPAV